MLLHVFGILCITKRCTSGHNSIDGIYDNVRMEQGCIKVLQNHEWEFTRQFDIRAYSVVYRSHPFRWISLGEDKFHIGIVDISFDQTCAEIAWSLDDALLK